METRAHHVIIGAFAIGVFLLALGFVLWLSKSSIDREFAVYDIVFNEAVTGLSKGGLVQYNGIKVGEVTQLSLAQDVESGRIVSQASATRTAGANSRTGAAIGGLIGLIVGVLAALLWDPLTGRRTDD